MASDPVVAYLDYLKEMARKIAYRGTFVNVLHLKSAKSQDRYQPWEGVRTQEDRQRYYAGVDQDMRSQDGRMLFLGIGLLVGRLANDRKGVLVAAPMLTIPIELEPPEENGGGYEAEPLWTSISVNYDLVTAILERNNIVDPDDAMGMPDLLTPATSTAFASLEHQLDTISRQAGASQRLVESSFIDRIAADLRANLPTFRDCIKSQAEPFRKENLRSLVEREHLTWFNHCFTFMGSMPDSLSASNALGTLCAKLKGPAGQR